MSAATASVTVALYTFECSSLPSTELRGVKIVPRAVAAASDPSTSSSFSSTTSLLGATLVLNPSTYILTGSTLPTSRPGVIPETSPTSVAGPTDDVTEFTLPTSTLTPVALETSATSVSNPPSCNCTAPETGTASLSNSPGDEAGPGLTPIGPGVITGIVLGIVFFLAAIFILACWRWWRPRVRRRAAEDIAKNSIALKSQGLDQSHVKTTLERHDV